ncbi:MAG: asparaginase [Betaproteobacteria bacterium]|nr:asparaginase [Betaproteobacteria bacterium]
MENPILVEALRGDTVESFHRGAVAVVDDHGGLVWSCGDIERAIFPRSAVKLLQALPLVASGAADRLGLTAAELALACASHGGERAHADTAASMLGKAGVNPSILECGVHWPSHEDSERELARLGAEPTALNNNCSGKHSGFVCVGCAISGLSGRPLADFMRGYVEPEHPVMQQVTRALEQATDHPLTDVPRGIDGCSIPTYAIPLFHLAFGFARAATGHGLSRDLAQAAARLRAAIAQEPFMVAGTGRFDTRVMQRLGHRVCCKIGAEGVYCASLPERGWGVALKMDDGTTSRAAEVVMAALIEALLPLSAEDANAVRGLSETVMRNWQGRTVGSLRAAPAFRSALSGLGH